jgi:outer membrane receptor protein involved in Fe transport
MQAAKPASHISQQTDTIRGKFVKRQSSPEQAVATNNPIRLPSCFRLAPIALAGLVLAATNPAHAADPDPATPEAGKAPEAAALDAVTVRSRNRIEKLQDVPLSISVIPGAELNRLNAYSIEELTRRAGNVQWNQGNQRTSSISIRGIGKVGQTEAQDPSVGIIVDGVSYAYNALTSSFDFIDIDTIEVSRGPQGTLLGKNTSVGNIIFNTKRPSFTPTTDFQLALFPKNRGLQAWSAITGPVIDNLLAWRGTFSVSRSEGDIANPYNRDITYTNKDRVSGRLQFLLTPSDNLNAILRLDLQPRAGETTNGRSLGFKSVIKNYVNSVPSFNGGSTVYSPSTTTEDRLARRWFSDVKSYTLDEYYNTVTTDAARGLVTGSSGVSLEVNWKLGQHTLTSITAFKNYHFNAVNDEGTPFDISRNSGGYWNDYKQKSQELRLSSPVGGFVDYQTGLYFIQAQNSATYNQIYGNDYGAWNASAPQYSTLDADGAGRYLLLSSAANLKTGKNATTGVQAIDNKSAAIFGQANWHLSDRLTFTTGARLTREDRNNTGSNQIFDNGSAPELNPVASPYGVQLGGFNTSTTGALVAGGNNATQLALADYTAKKYFNAVINTSNPGAAYNSLTANQKRQIAAAKAIRSSALGVIFNPTVAEPYRATQPTLTLSPSYKFTPDTTGYFSFQHGEKAGIAQLYQGVSYQVKAEKTNNFELGFKSALLNKTLIFNADVFLSNIKNYQTSVQQYDAYATAQAQAADPTITSVSYAGITGNVPKVKVYGIEIDGVYAGIPRTTLRFSGAYNRAKYDEFPNSAYPAERANESTNTKPYFDASGQDLPGTPKFTFNIGANYRQPIFGEHELHTSANWSWTSGSYGSSSIYSYVAPNGKIDWAVGIGKSNGTLDLSLLVKNLLNDKSASSISATSITPAVPRSIGLQFTAKI